MIFDTHTHHHRLRALINASHTAFSPSHGHFYSLGLHPWHIHACDVSAALQSISSLASQHQQIIAIGECGLDSLIPTPIDVQTAVFEHHITLSESLQKPLIIHCVHRSNEILQLHRKHSPRQPWIIHGFRANANVLRPLLLRPGIFISIGEKFNPEAVKLLPLNRLLVETDESPTPISLIVSAIALTKNAPATLIADASYRNILQIFPYVSKSL